MKYIKSKKGFTLLELLITMAIIGILMVAISMFIFPTMSFFAKSQKAVSAKNAANLMMDYIEGSVYSTNELTLQPRVSTLNTVAAGHFLITADENKGITTYKSGDASRSAAFGAEISAALRFRVTFTKSREQVLGVKIEVFDAQHPTEQLYSLSKSIYLANLLEDNIKTSPGTIQEIQFTKPDGDETLPA